MKVEPNVVISEFIVNMDEILYHKDNSKIDIAEKVKKQTDSLAHFKVPYYVLTNGPSRDDVGDGVTITHLDLFEHYPNLTLYFYRILMAFDFLKAHPEIEKAALTDAGDVTMLNYPFDDVQDGILYMGDETTSLFNTSIIIDNAAPTYMKDFIWENNNLTILNLGIMVGTRDILIEYLGIMVKLITDAELRVKQGDDSYSVGNFEMLISNYVAYRYFSTRLIHGRKVSTIFNGFQEHSSAWFKHK
ncbi:hypothetical protein GBO86_08125 [Pediococcus acidilactici]|nr:hypothetical protein GBO86_08125 [Pediococcus acidilactici]UWF33292.1 hypothetical protein NYR25_06755 [Pediococcus acidilactici]